MGRMNFLTDLLYPTGSNPNSAMNAADWRSKLDDVRDAIDNLQDRHDRLQDDYHKLSIRYYSTKQCVMDSIWRYIPEKCNNHFEYIPKLDTTLKGK